jgi:photosystem II stability/assembly factor-like uncharacterized protein
MIAPGSKRGLALWGASWGCLLGGALAVACSSSDPSKAGEHRQRAPSALRTRVLVAAARADRRILAAGELGEIRFSDDAGRTWQRADVPTDTTITALHFYNGILGWAVGHNATILRTENAGRSWTKVHETPGVGDPLLDVWFADEHRGIAVGAYGLVMRTTDGGRRWTSGKLSPDEDPHLYGIVCGHNGVLFAAGESGTFVRSEDEGLSWKRLASPSGGSYFGLNMLPDGSLLLYGMGGRVVWVDSAGEHAEELLPADSRFLIGGTVLGDGTVVLVGLEGAVTTGAPGSKRLVRARAPDHTDLAAAVPLTGDRLLTVGRNGVHELHLSELKEPHNAHEPSGS